MENIEQIIIDLESSALDRWNNGDPDGYLGLYDSEISYFDPVNRITGLPDMEDYYRPVRGSRKVDCYSMVDPRVQAAGADSAVLTYNLHQSIGEQRYVWSCTQVYRRKGNGEWKIIHNHWSEVATSRQTAQLKQ